ncbi:C45 family peptidase [Actinomadura sp. KC345]|uniref:C45 family autoproteolytic acyltransferase/hydolase n=1 Tax=Actinomadura sp. KC345 TaxID=2530371 RepID=UPI001A9F7932|nr:C45 family peptidase [Actinomadura sp. KC345]
MTFPEFVSARSGPAERGREFGVRWSTEIAAAHTGYMTLFETLGGGTARVRALSEEALAQTTAWAPPLGAEIRAIAAGAGLEPWRIASVNARTEILAALNAPVRSECSTAVVLPDGAPPRTVQTWDWHDVMRDVPVVWAYEPRPGHRVRTFTEFGALAKVGVNGAGLGVHFNILGHASDGGATGVPVHMIARRVLDEAATLEDAERIARSARTSASTAITVVTYDGRRGRAATLEICPDGVGVVPPDRDGVLLHTNHFEDPGLAAGEAGGDELPGSRARLGHLRSRTRALTAPTPRERADALIGHAPGDAPVCAHPTSADPSRPRWETLATISLDVDAGALDIHKGGPCLATQASWRRYPRDV